MPKMSQSAAQCDIPATPDPKPGDIVRLHNGSLMLVHSLRDHDIWPLVGWRVVACNDLSHRADYTLGTLRQTGRDQMWKIRSLEVVHCKAVAIVQSASRTTVNAVVSHAREAHASMAWEDRRNGRRFAR